MVNNKCDTATRLADVGEGRGGCAPVPLKYSLAGDALTLTEIRHSGRLAIFPLIVSGKALCRRPAATLYARPEIFDAPGRLCYIFGLPAKR